VHVKQNCAKCLGVVASRKIFLFFNFSGTRISGGTRREVGWTDVSLLHIYYGSHIKYNGAS
jgi:hypothetical protein